MHCSAILHFFSVDTRVRRELAHVSTCIYKKAAKLLSGFSPGQNLQSPSLDHFGSFWINCSESENLASASGAEHRRTSQNPRKNFMSSEQRSISRSVSCSNHHRCRHDADLSYPFKSQNSTWNQATILPGLSLFLFWTKLFVSGLLSILLQV